MEFITNNMGVYRDKIKISCYCEASIENILELLTSTKNPTMKISCPRLLFDHDFSFKDYPFI